MDKQAVIDKIQNYTYYSNRLKEIKEQIERAGYGKTTATYGNLAGGGGSGNSSKVESKGIKHYELDGKKLYYENKIAEIKRLIEHSGLDKREKALMWWIARNGKLQAYARRERIGKDNVYKIRDRAVNKIIAANTPQNAI